MSNVWPSLTKQSPMDNFLNTFGSMNTADVKSPQLTWMFDIAQPELHSLIISTLNKRIPLDHSPFTWITAMSSLEHVWLNLLELSSLFSIILDDRSMDDPPLPAFTASTWSQRKVKQTTANNSECTIQNPPWLRLLCAAIVSRSHWFKIYTNVCLSD